MPQVFQILKCFKCSVFQVHQTKKSNKWECKLCGEKQSIKRHYGLGTGKECRLHVQKLNAIRGQNVELNELAKLDESSDDEDAAKSDTSFPNKRQLSNLKSKWSEFVDKTEDVKVPEPESMYIGNAEVVLEVPAKQKKFAKPKVTKNTSVAVEVDRKTYLSKHFQKCIKNNLNEVTTTYTDNDLRIKVTSRETEFVKQNKTQEEIKTFVPHKVKNSKWAQYEDESNGGSCSSEDLSSTFCNDENITATKNTNNDLKIPKDKNRVKIRQVETKNIFTLCNEDDLDDVLDF